jgi:pimeloyl-ACP methyl ester carboxylesterase
MTKPLLHFAHANGVPSAVYSKMLHALEDRFDVRTLPLLGTDPRYPVTDNWPHLVDQVADSIREQCDAPVVGVGHSMGGLCTFMAAHRYPELFRAVVIMDPPVINGAGALSFWAMKKLGLSDRVTPAGKSAGRREIWNSRDEVRASLGKKAFFRAFDPDCFEDYLLFGFTNDEAGGVRLTIPVATEVAVFRATPHNAWRYRRPLKVPGVLLTGAQSEFAGTGFGERLARHHRLLHEQVAGGHMFPLEQPLLTAETIKRTLAQVGVGA